ncbi:DUF4236 domain-containing protein [Ralstonia solanacearum]|uniref:DUF4236 domain-containing protein n=1 Tax=Ralstonia solanacearum TaxID=305 RepID=UPI001865DC0E|nr:DUF4236 domain-containing protein [Ralstonia solanacearum]
MGFYVRQSVKVGPLRFNFSKSGVGVSTGVKGIRIGTGPRGNYIHMGRGHRLIHISPHPLKINDLLEPACERRTAIIQRSTTRSALFQGVPGGCAQK